MQVSIQTAQNVQIDQDKAGVGNRVLAFAIDLLIISLVAAGINYIMTKLGYFDQAWLNILLYFPLFFYDLYMEILNNGQSLGKMAMNIRVVRLDGFAPTIGGYILRWILRPIDVMLGGSVAIISIILSENGQRLGDLAAGTTIIKLKKTEQVSRLQLVEKMEEEYEPVYPEARNLSDKDVTIIKECLRMKANHMNAKPVMLMADKVKEILNIESEESDMAFLYTLLRDHTYYSMK